MSDVFTSFFSNENLRIFLYPLGFLSAIAFGARFLFQWINSEKKGKSIVTPFFWKLSLIGNLLLFVHSLIQIQFHVYLVQACNALISWRNLNLMKESKKQVSFKFVIYFFLIIIAGSSFVFALQNIYSSNENIWFRVPVAPWSSDNAVTSISFIWHVVGFFGLILFAMRFWVQWWLAEQHKTSYLGPSFWWLSLAGDLLSLIYFIRIGDFVNIIGPALGLIPYIRNLMIIRKSKQTFNLQP